jgi:hypothetical protein
MHHLYWNSHSLLFVHRRLHIKTFIVSCALAEKDTLPNFPAISQCTSAMQDPPRKFDVTISKPTLETQYFQRHSTSVTTTSMDSGYSCSQSPAVHSASFSASSPSHFELSQNGSEPRSPRRLPVPPTYASPPASSLSMSYSSSSSHLSSSSTLSLPTPKHPPHSWSVFVS